MNPVNESDTNERQAKSDELLQDALEMAAGRAQELGLKAGDELRLLSEAA